MKWKNGLGNNMEMIEDKGITSNTLKFTLCVYCNCMTYSIRVDNKHICGKCKMEKHDIRKNKICA
jgi:hypothetical protein